jgi:signal peptidase II
LSNTRPRRISRLAPMVVVATTVLVLDQLTKAWISANMATHDTRPIIQGFARLRYTENSGAAFGLFQGWTGALSIVAVAIIAAIMLSASRMSGNNRAIMLAIGLVLGGALGNLGDRLALGYVRDFIEVYGPHVEWNGRIYTWPVFNVADSAITVGVLIIMAVLIFGKQNNPAGEEKLESLPPPYQEHKTSPWLRGVGQTGTED